MQFDQTYIAIRKRNMLEIIDLSLHVVRDYLRPLGILWLIGCVPLLFLNWFLIGWLSNDYYDSERLVLYCHLMAVLIITQSQIATMWMTCFLGQVIFSERPSVSAAIREGLKTPFYFYWNHCVYRMLLPVILIALLISSESDGDSIYVAAVWMTLAGLFGLLVRCVRPFINEIICLEKTPIRKSETHPINFAVRSRSLHQAANAELLSRYLILVFLAAPLTFLVLGMLLMADSLLNLSYSSERLPLLIYGPIACWIVAGFFAVVRFLSYIDIRIRQEGWEVELRLRSQAMQLEDKMRQSAT